MLAITQGFSKAIQASIERTVESRHVREWIPASRPRSVQDKERMVPTAERAA